MKKGLLDIVGILNIVFGILFTITLIGSLVGIPLIVSGSMFLHYSSLSDDKLIS